MARYVVGIDGSENSSQALAWTVDEARRRGAEVSAVLAWSVSFETGGLPPSATDLERIRAAQRATLDTVVDAVDENDLVAPIERVCVERSPRALLVDRADEADLLVVGTRGREGFAGLLLGSVAEYCLHHAPCPVVLVPGDRVPDSGRVTVGCDGSDRSIAALRWAVERSSVDEPPVRALHAFNWLDQPKGEPFSVHYDEAAARARLEATLEEAGVDLTRVAVETVNDLPAPSLIERSEQGDLLVVGTRGHGALKRMMVGSVTRKLAHHTRSPLVVHRPD